MRSLVHKSKQLTGYLETLLDETANDISVSCGDTKNENTPWTIITPRNAGSRGAMLSLRWSDSGILDKVVERLNSVGIVVDVKKPDLMRVTPTALYNTFEDVWRFIHALKEELM